MDYQLISKEEYTRKEYLKVMTPSSARVYLSARAGMLKTIKMNFVNDRRFSSELWTCPHPDCTAIDTMSHLRWCAGYTHLRQGLNLDKDQDMVQYYKAIIKQREEDNK